MKCKDFEQNIYLYKELGASEKKNVDDHVACCESCCELFSMVQHAEGMLSLAATVKPQSENFSRLTSRILKAVEKEKPKSASWINVSFIKYAMAAASCIVIIVFGAETFSTSEPVVKHYSSAKTITLNSVSIAESYRSKREQLLKRSFYACVKNGDCHTLIENFKKSL